LNATPIKLVWHRFGTFEDARKDPIGKVSSVYVQADRKGRVLKVGKAPDSFHHRFWPDTTTNEAAMYGSGNQIFVAEVSRKLCSDVERQMILDEHPPFNKKQKWKPKGPITAYHSGDKPAFSSISKSS